MKIQDLKLQKRSSRRRVGRGISAGGGKTAGRGTKGQNSRSGGQRNPGFEGGQNTLFHRIPKLKGFKSLTPKKQIVHTSSLDRLSSRGKVTVEDLYQVGLVNSSQRDVKLLFDSDPTKVHHVSLSAASKEAVKSLTRTGGSFEEQRHQATKSAAKTDKFTGHTRKT